MTRRVLEIIPTLDRNGAEKQLALLASGLPRDEFDVHVCALTRGGPLAEPLRQAGIPVTVIGKRWKIDPVAWWRLRKLIVRLKPDLVHTWIFAANSYGRQAAFSAGVPVVLAGERCVDPWKRGYELAIDRYLARRTRRIVTNSSGVVDFYVKQGLPADKFAVIPNGIAIEQPSASIAREALLAELGLPPHTWLIGAVGRLWPQKRYKDLIWAIELLRCARSEVHLIIVGEGPERWRLERFAGQVVEERRVHFLGERSDVARLLPHLDCFWLGSGYEGQSNALMEAMAAGRPVVATDIPGNRDLIVPNESGLLVPVGDRAALARQTYRLIGDPAEARRLGDNARQRMRAEFSVERMIERHSALYHEVLGR